MNTPNTTPDDRTASTTAVTPRLSTLFAFLNEARACEVAAALCKTPCGHHPAPFTWAAHQDALLGVDQHGAVTALRNHAREVGQRVPEGGGIVDGPLPERRIISARRAALRGVCAEPGQVGAGDTLGRGPPDRKRVVHASTLACARVATNPSTDLRTSATATSSATSCEPVVSWASFALSPSPTMTAQ